MLFPDHLIAIRGGGDLGSGVAYMLNRAGFPVVILELAEPLVIRRAVSFAAAVSAGEVVVDGVAGRLVDAPAAATWTARRGEVAVLVSAELPADALQPTVIVDARIAKRNIDTTIDQAPLVVALGPGFAAGDDCDAVVETMRGHDLGRVIWRGPAAADTGIPGELGGASSGRIVRAPAAGSVMWDVAIGDTVVADRRLGIVASSPISAPIAGVVRGLISPTTPVEVGLKVADIDPRSDRAACFTISDKSRLVGAGVLEAVLTRLNGR